MEIGFCSLDQLFLFENMDNSGYFPNGKEFSLRKADIENNLSTDIKLYQQSFIINSVVSSTTDFKGLRRLMTFRTFELEREDQN
jgi:hypothetical protein